MFQKHKAFSRGGAAPLLAAALLLVVADLWVPLYDPLNADEENEVYASLREAPPGRLLELPALPPDDYARQRLPLLRDAGAARAAARLLDLGAAGSVPGRAQPAGAGARARRHGDRSRYADGRPAGLVTP